LIQHRCATDLDELQLPGVQRELPDTVGAAVVAVENPPMPDPVEVFTTAYRVTAVGASIHAL
jgi:hypothetical protein